MGQATLTATTDERRWSCALRPMVLLGGFVLVWWFLMTGTAQAGDGPARELADTASAVTGSVERVVDRQADRRAPAAAEDRQHQSPVTKVTRTVHRHVAPVVAPVTAPVASIAKQTVENDVEPVTTRTTDTVRTVVGKVVKDVRSGLEKTPAGSVVPPELELDAFEDTTPKVGESSTQQGETRSEGSRAERFGTAASMLPIAGVVADLPTESAAVDAEPNAAAPNGQDTAVPTLPGGVDRDGAVSPADHDGASAVPSGNGGGLAAGQTGEALVIVPATNRTSTVTYADRLPAGPAYPPASSPD